VKRVGHEPGAALDLGEERSQLRLRDRRDATAGDTDEVLVGRFVRQVVHQRLMAEVGVGHEAGALERLERAVHRRLVDGDAQFGVGTLVNVGGAEMVAAGGGEDGADGSSGLGHPKAVVAECLDQELGRRHGPKRSVRVDGIVATSGAERGRAVLPADCVEEDFRRCVRAAFGLG
jgi:hypothetical protein